MDVVPKEGCGNTYSRSYRAPANTGTKNVNYTVTFEAADTSNNRKTLKDSFTVVGHR